MRRECSVYEAKAHLSELLRDVRSTRKEVVITHRGERIAKLVPFEEESSETLAERIARIESSGLLLPALESPATLARSTARPSRGALSRFLKDRD